jgi:hypothetical protein
VGGKLGAAMGGATATPASTGGRLLGESFGRAAVSGLTRLAIQGGTLDWQAVAADTVSGLVYGGLEQVAADAPPLKVYARGGNTDVAGDDSPMFVVGRTGMELRPPGVQPDQRIAGRRYITDADIAERGSIGPLSVLDAGREFADRAGAFIHGARVLEVMNAAEQVLGGEWAQPDGIALDANTAALAYALGIPVYRLLPEPGRTSPTGRYALTADGTVRLGAYFADAFQDRVPGMAFISTGASTAATYDYMVQQMGREFVASGDAEFLARHVPRGFEALDVTEIYNRTRERTWASTSSFSFLTQAEFQELESNDRLSALGHNVSRSIVNLATAALQITGSAAGSVQRLWSLDRIGGLFRGEALFEAALTAVSVPFPAGRLAAVVQTARLEAGVGAPLPKLWLKQVGAVGNLKLLTPSRARDVLALPPGRASSELRDLPGIASGGLKLPKVEGHWLRGSHGNLGSVPGQVAEKLNGRRFQSFDRFREAFWEEIAADPILSRQFSGPNLRRMEQGMAPVAHSSQHHGEKISYVLHHKLPIHQGGAVYDMSNLVVVTPRMHAEILDGSFHFGGAR